MSTPQRDAPTQPAPAQSPAPSPVASAPSAALPLAEPQRRQQTTRFPALGGLTGAIFVLGIVVVLAGCSSPRGAGGGGGSSVIACDAQSPCPSGYVCVGAVCQWDGDVTSNQDSVAGADSGVVDGGAVDTGVADAGPADAGVLDGGPPDTGVVDSGPLDGGTTDTGISDTGAFDSGPPDAGGSTVTIQSIQSGNDSLQCASPNGEKLTFEAVQLQDAVVTADVGPLSKTVEAFYVRPLADPPFNGQYGGLKIVRFGGGKPIAVGDIVRLTGDVVEYYCETELKVEDAEVTILGSAAQPGPIDVTVSQIAFDSPGGEPWEGVLVRLQNVVVAVANELGTDGKTHGQFSVSAQGGTDRVVVGGTSETTFTKQDPDSGDLITTMVKGQIFSTLIGHLSYSFGQYVLRPRADTDLQP